jgi:hypothetical protein
MAGIEFPSRETFGYRLWFTATPASSSNSAGLRSCPWRVHPGSTPGVQPGDRPVAAQPASLQAEGAGTADRRRRPPDCGRRGIRASSIQRMIVTSETPRRKPIDFNDAPAWYHRSIRVIRERCTSIWVSIRAFLTAAILAALAALRSTATVASLWRKETILSAMWPAVATWKIVLSGRIVIRPPRPLPCRKPKKASRSRCEPTSSKWAYPLERCPSDPSPSTTPRQKSRDRTKVLSIGPW